MILIVSIYNSIPNTSDTMKHMFTDCRLNLGFIIFQDVQHICKHLDSTVSSMKDSLAIFSLVILLTVDGRNPAPVQVGNLSHYFYGFIHPRWCRISSINSIDIGLIQFFVTEQLVVDVGCLGEGHGNCTSLGISETAGFTNPKKKKKVLNNSAWFKKKHNLKKKSKS